MQRSSETIGAIAAALAKAQAEKAPQRSTSPRTLGRPCNQSLETTAASKIRSTNSASSPRNKSLRPTRATLVHFDSRQKVQRRFRLPL